MKKVNKVVTVDENGEIPLTEFKEYIDITKVVYYKVVGKKGSAAITFYDKKKKLLKLLPPHVES